VIPALALITPTVTGNDMAVREIPERIVSKTTHAALTLAAAQARNSLIDFMAVWGKLATLREGRRSFIITDSGLTSSGTNRDNRSGSKHVISGEEDGEKTCETKAKNKSNKIRK
jgi:hypothetical protein